MTRVFVARLAGLSVFDPLGDQVGRVRDVVVTFSARRRGAPRHRPRRRGVRPAPGLRADDPGHERRRRAGHHHRPGQHAPVRAAAHRDAGAGRAARPHGDGHHARGPATTATVEDVAIEQERNRDWVIVKVFVRKGLRGRSRGISRLAVAAARPSLVDDRPGHRAAARRRRPGRRQAARDASTTLKAADLADVHPRPVAQAPRRGRRRAGRREARRRPGGAARGRPGRDPRPARATSAPPTCSRRCSPTTPPTCSPSCRRRRPSSCCS